MSKYNKLINVDIEGKNILIREDLNVPTKDNSIVNDARIKAAIPTIQYALSKEQNWQSYLILADLKKACSIKSIVLKLSPRDYQKF